MGHKNLNGTSNFILVCFSAHNITKVNIMRQLQYGAGGFRTSQELFPLLNCGCKFVKLYRKKETSKHDTVASAKKGSQMGIPSTTQLSQPPKGKEKRYESWRKEKKVNYEIKDDLMDQEGGGKDGGL